MSEFLLEMGDQRNFTRPQSPMRPQFPVHPQPQSVYSESPHMYPQSAYPRPQSQSAFSQIQSAYPHPQSAFSQPRSQFAYYSQYPVFPQSAYYSQSQSADYSQTPQIYPQSSYYSHPQSQSAYYSQSQSADYSQTPQIYPQSSYYSHPQSQSAYSQSPQMFPQFQSTVHPQHDYFQKPQPSKPLMNLGQSISKQTDFSLSLAKHVITAEAKDANFVFSPLSIHIVLCMVAAGAGGPTRDQLLGYLKSKSVEELNSLSSQVATLLFADGGPLGGPRLSFADGLWVDQIHNLKPAFKEIVENDYKAATNQVDFRNKAEEVREEVNAWAEKETNGLIKDLLPPGSVDSTTQLILGNALYFKGAWADKFEKSLTKNNNFFLSYGTKVRVPFMTSWKKQLVCAFDGFKVLKLPYEQGNDNRRFSMYFYLPDARDGLPSLVEKFGSIPGFIERHLPYKPVELGEFRVPKFKIEFDFEASGILKGQGLVLPFSGGLTEMVDGSLMISQFFHKASIEVDEEGTEAAAASACLMGYGCSMQVQEKLDFVADHPFLFVIREDVSGGVLFVGQLTNPLLN